MVRRYKKIVSWSIGVCVQAVKIIFQMPQGCCRFYPSCTEFAKEAVEKLPISKAIQKIFKRIIKCHPFAKGGFDPVVEEASVWKAGYKSE